MRKSIGLVLVLGFLVFIAAPAVSFAGITTYTDPVAFANQGTIVENYGYEDWGSGFSFPPDPWTAHGVTYTTTDNLIIGPATSYNPVSNIFCNNYWTPLTATINNAS